MEAVHQPIEHGVGHVAWILEADAHPRQHLLTLPIDLLRRERGVACHVRQHPHPDIEAVLHDDHVQVTEIRPCARAHCPADEIDRIRHLLGRHRLRALIEKVCREVCETQLRLRIRRAAGADQQAYADDGLLMVQDGDDLQTVRQSLQLIRREFHVMSRKRLRRIFGRPFRLLSEDGATETKRHGEEIATEPRRHRTSWLFSR